MIESSESCPSCVMLIERQPGAARAALQRSPPRCEIISGFGRRREWFRRTQPSLDSSRSPSQGWGKSAPHFSFPRCCKAPALPSQSCRARRGCPVPINAPPDAAREQWRRAEEVIDAAQAKEGQLEALEERHRPDGRQGPLRGRAAPAAAAPAGTASCGRAAAAASRSCSRSDCR